ncbi:hypothetical protein PC39_10927 [Salinisphaera sp. PC39]|uniref:hypothetical protein n=1 Tax=Salinisphaera sp. PC39 TaxID=1304156 RepID=UPI00334025E7
MDKRLAVVALLTAGLALAGCSATGGQGGSAPGASTGFLGKKRSDIEVDKGKAFAGTQKVVIGGFKVGFVEYKKMKAKAGGGFLGSGFGGKSLAKVTLAGVDETTRQVIVDAAYADFVSGLSAAGYEVVDRGVLLSSDAFSGAKTHAAPYETDDSTLAVGADVTYYVPTEFDGKIRIFMSDAMGLGGALGWSHPSSAATKFADEHDGALRVLVVNYLIDFANSENYGGMHTSTSSVSVYQGLSIKPDSGVEIIGGHGGTFSSAVGSLRLGQAKYSTETFGEVVDVTSSASKTTETVVNVASALLGGGTNVSRRYEVQADPGRFAALSGSLLAEANAALLEQMTALR